MYTGLSEVLHTNCKNIHPHSTSNKPCSKYKKQEDVVCWSMNPITTRDEMTKIIEH